MSKSLDVSVSLEFTPNPNTLKYSVNRELLSQGAMNYTQVQTAVKSSPLAALLFAVSGVSGVMVGKNFVTVSKTEEADWDTVHREASKTIQDYLTKNQSVFLEGAVEAARASKKPASQVEAQIRDILDHEIRPALAMDGGDVAFEKFEDGIVYLYLQGACAGCPGAAATLKMGIEARLREMIPEVLEVVSV
ncbi:NifU family protein [Bdellovibrionota bacterium FG-2]